MAVRAEERLILALDVPLDREHPERPVVASDVDRVVEELDGLVNVIKIGWATFMTDHAQPVLQRIRAHGKDLFYDLKFSETTDTVRRYVQRALDQHARFATINTAFSTVAAAVDEMRRRGGSSSLSLLMVTVLTSLDEGDLRDMGIQRTVEEHVRHVARRAVEVGCQGVIASGREARRLRREVPDDFLIVTPAIRPAGTSQDDQKRATTPTAAIESGADYLVVGRPITQAVSPRDATARIVEEMQAAFDRRG